MTPGTLGSLNSLTHTLSLGDSKLKVVLTQARSSARAAPAPARSSTAAARYHLMTKFHLPSRAATEMARRQRTTHSSILRRRGRVYASFGAGKQTKAGAADDRGDPGHRHGGRCRGDLHLPPRARRPVSARALPDGRAGD